MSPKTALKTFLATTAKSFRDTAAELDGVVDAIDGKDNLSPADMLQVQQFADGVLRSTALSAALLKSFDPAHPPRFAKRVAA